MSALVLFSSRFILTSVPTRRGAAFAAEGDAEVVPAIKERSAESGLPGATVSPPVAKVARAWHKLVDTSRYGWLRRKVTNENLEKGGGALGLFSL